MREKSTRRYGSGVGNLVGLVALASVLLATPRADASITGVCPDGSIFIVQRASSVPCRGAKTVDPSDVPPIRPEFLPRPYGWEVFNRRNDPNNPYNLIHVEPMDAPRAVRERNPSGYVRDGVREGVREERVSVREAFDSGGTAPVSAAPSAAVVQQVPFGLANREIRDLAMIVDLSQRRAPAALLARGSGGRVQLARSVAFESRLHLRFAEGGDHAIGKVVLFRVDTQEAGSFYGNLTFVQGHMAFQPDSGDPSQLGLIHGTMGELGVDEPVLGYVVLPAYMDLSQPVDIYWNDLQITATLAP